MTVLALTVLGHDRPGIIAEVTGALADLGGNLEDSSMTLLRGHFAWTLIVDTDRSADEIESRVASLRDEGLVVSVLPVPERQPDSASGQSFLLSVHGADRPGIVSAVTRVVADHGGNVTDLTTRLGTNLYLLTAEVELPADADLDSLNMQLHSTAEAIGVDAHLVRVEPDVL